MTRQHRLTLVLLLALAPVLGGCVVGAVAGTAVGVTAGAVGTAAKVTTTAVGAGANVAGAAVHTVAGPANPPPKNGAQD